MDPLDEIVQEMYSKYSGVQGIICQADGDEGDSLQREATFHLLYHYLNPTRSNIIMYSISLQSLETTPGYYSRSADQTKWYGDYRYTSRDQLSVAMAACAMTGNQSELRTMALLLLRRGGFHTNIYRNGISQGDQQPKVPDFISPDQLGAIIRGYRIWLLYPLLTFLDLSLLFMVVYGRTLKPWDADNMLLSWLVLSNTKMPTITSWLAKKLYASKARDVLTKLKNYHSLQNNGIPPLFEIQRLAFRKLIT
jgi:hypothetical protein